MLNVKGSSGEFGKNLSKILWNFEFSEKIRFRSQYHEIQALSQIVFHNDRHNDR